MRNTLISLLIAALVCTALSGCSRGLPKEERARLDKLMRGLTTRSLEPADPDFAAYMRELTSAAKDKRLRRYFYEILEGEDNFAEKSVSLLVLQRAGDEKLNKYIKDMLISDVIRERYIAVNAAALFGLKEYIPRLKEISERDPDENVRFMAGQAYMTLKAGPIK
jgi:HEAT repeat protein